MASAGPTTGGRIRIRAAKPTDERAVRALCRRIWSDDYVGGVFRDWVRDRRGRLWVATADGTIAGVAKLSLVGDHEAWLHGLRVDPRFRRHGLATLLARHRLDRARRLGARVARMDTSKDNIAVHRIAAHLGFSRIARINFFRRRTGGGVPPRAASPRELAVLWRLTRESDGLMHEEFAARRVRRIDLARAVRERRALVVGEPPRALAIVVPVPDRIRVLYLAGGGRALVELLQRLPAAVSGARARFVGGPFSSAHWRALRAAGYRQPWDYPMDILERRLGPSDGLDGGFRGS